MKRKILSIILIATLLLSVFALGASASMPDDLSNTHWLLEPGWLSNTVYQFDELEGTVMDMHSPFHHSLKGRVLSVGSDFVESTSTFKVDENCIVLVDPSQSKVIARYDSNDYVYLNITGGNDASSPSLRGLLGNSSTNARNLTTYSGDTYDYNGHVLNRYDIVKKEHYESAYLLFDGEYYTMVTSSYPLMIRQDLMGNIYWVSSSTPNTFAQHSYDGSWHTETFEVIDSPEWEYGVGVIPQQIVWSSTDLYTEDGLLKMLEGDPNFFEGNPLYPNILPAPVVPIPELAVEGILPEVHRVMGILAIAGVSLIALLVGLRLFGKRSLISRG